MVENITEDTIEDNSDLLLIDNLLTKKRRTSKRILKIIRDMKALKKNIRFHVPQHKRNNKILKLISDMNALKKVTRVPVRKVKTIKKVHVVHKNNKKIFCKTVRVCNKCCDRKKRRTICRSCCKNFKVCRKILAGLNRRVNKIAKRVRRVRKAFRVATKTGIKCRIYTRYGCFGKRVATLRNKNCKRRVRVCKKYVFHSRRYIRKLNRAIKKTKNLSKNIKKMSYREMLKKYNILLLVYRRLFIRYLYIMRQKSKIFT